MSWSTLLLLPLLVASAARAANDWTKPCFEGECSYDLPQSTQSGSMRIWGSPDAISDITTAAGWTILTCDKDSLTQDIRLVCHDASVCNHLYQNLGATGKLVRLPEDCGSSPFARMVKSWVHSDQSIPPTIVAQVKLPNGTMPLVRGITLDTNFAALDPSQYGNVSIAIQGSTIPGANNDAAVASASFQRRSSYYPRSSQEFVESAFTSFDQNISTSLPPIDLDENFPVLEAGVFCPASGNIPAFNATISAALDTQVHAVIQLGIAVAGTIIPPVLTEAGVFVGLNSQFSGTLDLHGTASGNVSVSVPLYQTDIPGLDFPGILTLGPSFEILAEVDADLDLDVDLKVAMNYTINNAQLFFPPSANQSSGGVFTQGDSPLTLSVAPSVASRGSVAAHLIPRVDLGITVLSGIAEASVFLDLDAFATLTLSLDASDAVSTTTILGARTPESTGTVDRDISKRSSTVNGCVDIAAGFDVNAGATADLFDIFDTSTTVTLYKLEYDLYQNCFGTSSERKRRLRGVDGDKKMSGLGIRDDSGLTCTFEDPADLFSIV